MLHKIQHAIEPIPFMGLNGYTNNAISLTQTDFPMAEAGYTIVNEKLQNNTQTIIIAVRTAFAHEKTGAFFSCFWIGLSVMARVASFSGYPCMAKSGFK